MKSGFVAVLGKPNVGKSTLVNEVVGQKISIVSDKPQTTRKRVFGIATTDDWQIVFVDTPGLHEAKTTLGKALNEAARGSTADVDVLLIMVDGSRMPTREDQTVADIIKKSGWLGEEKSKRAVLCLNKMDIMKAERVQQHFDAYTALFPGPEVMMTSLTKKENVEKLVQLLLDRLPEGDLLYPEDQVTDQTMRFMAAELVREKALQLTREEVPHSVGVGIEGWDESNPRQIRIQAVIYCEKDGQKAILIGKGGAMLKKIGTQARVEIEEMTETPVFLELFVKVRDGWRSDMGILRELEYY